MKTEEAGAATVAPAGTNDSEDTMQVEGGKPFPARRYLIKVQGKQDYLPVAARVAWLRHDHPDWSITTTAIEINLHPEGRAPYAIFQATICDETGRIIAQGHKMEDAKGFPDFLEKAECVPVDTQILTWGGWKYHFQLVEGELVLSYDHENDRSEWVRLERVVTYEDAEVIRLHNGWGFDAICTPKHKWATYSTATAAGKKYEYRKLVESTSLNKGHCIVTACAAPDNFPQEGPSENEAAIMGWLLTDGSFRRGFSHNRPQGIIYQSKPDRVEEIRALLKDIPHREESRPAGVQTLPQGKDFWCMESFRFYLSADVMGNLFQSFGIKHESEVDKGICQMSRAARAAMLSAMMAGDGTEQGDFGKKRKPWVMHTFALLCALQGVSLSRIRRATKGDVPIQRLKKTRHTYVTNLQTESADRQDVWCPTTKYGTWYARFSNGFTTITGNTSAIGRAIANCGYGTLQCLDMDEGIERATNLTQGPQRATSGQQRVPDAPEPDNQYHEPFPDDPDDDVAREKASFYAVCKQLDIRVPSIGEEKRIINHVLKRSGEAGEVPPTAQEYNAAAARLPKIMAAQARKAQEEKEAVANG